MPLIETDLPNSHAPRVSVEPSIAVEIEWVMLSAVRPGFRQGNAPVAAIYERDPALLERARSIWDPEEATSSGGGGFLELIVLAHHGGLLFSTDAELLLDQLDGLCASVPVDPERLPLYSELPEDRAAVVLRLSRLRASADLRDRYVALVRDIWDAMRVEWERSGRGAVEVAMAARREVRAKGADWHEVVRSECDMGEGLDRTVAAVGPDAEVVVVPAYFTHKGLLVDLPGGVVVVGVRTDTTGAQARARTESLARRLKAISDPTRLAILDALRTGPRTATEIATAFSLAQPTVSNHVKVLRGAGLVTEVRHGTRRQLVVDNEMVEELITNLHEVLGERTVYIHGPHVGALVATGAAVTTAVPG
jgi:DNA-binding transcriptional ArsR family regulator